MRVAGAAREKSNSRSFVARHATLGYAYVLNSSVYGARFLDLTEDMRTRMQRSLQPDSWFHPQCPQNFSGQGR